MTKKKIGDTDFEFEQLADGAEISAAGTKVQIDNNGDFVSAKAFGNLMEKTADGMRITRPDGSTMTIHDDGSISVDNLIPKSVGIRDLSEIESYTIQNSAQGQLHKILFVNGGSLEVIYTNEGKFASLSGQNIQQTVTNDNEIFLSQGNKTTGTMN